MNLKQHIILIKGVNKTYSVESIEHHVDKFIVKFENSDKIYTYGQDNVVWLKNPVDLNIENIHVFINGRNDNHIKSVTVFSCNTAKFYAIESENGFVKQYMENEVEIRTSCLSGSTLNLFDYFRQCAGINTVGAMEDEPDSKGILSSIYSRIDFIDDNTVAATYLNPDKGINTNRTDFPIFPFGCNASQEKAVKIALSNQISVIQGPPGTGKTQTILNIIANLLISEKTVLIVSNNNSATENVLEKLTKNGFGFLVAPLGKKENKEAFIANQPKLNPELPLWRRSGQEINSAFNNVKEGLLSAENIFAMQERLATARQELAEVEVEKIHFQQENTIVFDTPESYAHSSKVIKILNKLRRLTEDLKNDNSGLWRRLKTIIRRLDVELRLMMTLKINIKLSSGSIHDIITFVEYIFYHSKISELRNAIKTLEFDLSKVDENALMQSLNENSMIALKAKLSSRFNHERKIIASTQDLYWNGGSVIADYPIVLSTTFSSKLCFDSDTIFDYVIMDEASQVAVDTGLLSLTCAKNAVIVGDTMQLPNVIKEADSLKLEEIKKSYGVSDAYDASRHSFLSSVLAAIPNIPETLLREHYRCHPDIINFCNQKFYGGNLLIMTQRHEGDSPLMAITTSTGHHSRGHYNQREIDTVKIELLPLLKDDPDIGIITPYNRQVDAFRSQLPKIEAATVHKYQGREKGTIIMSVTDDSITEFTDNANLLNVAVSRAKNKFCLVVSGNPQELKGNIYDLLGYIQYQHCVVIESKLHSIYDYLFTQISSQKDETDTISDYDSENLTYGLIEHIRKTVPQLSHIKVLCHYPLRYMIKDTTGMSDREIRYASHQSTHIDFLIINRVSKQPLLAIETDGYSFHNETSEQYIRDRMKDHILELYGLPMLRLSTVGHSEEQRIIDALLQG